MEIVAPLVVFELVVELLDLVLEERIASFEIGELAAQVGELRAETLHFVLQTISVSHIVFWVGSRVKRMR